MVHIAIYASGFTYISYIANIQYMAAKQIIHSKEVHDDFEQDIENWRGA